MYIYGVQSEMHITGGADTDTLTYDRKSITVPETGSLKPGLIEVTLTTAVQMKGQ